MDSFTEAILIEYVKEQRLDKKKNAEKVIYNFCYEQPLQSITVYRGHDNTPTIRQGLWYSASHDINVASNEFAGKDCCIFIIHLLNIPCIDVNEFIGDKIGDKNEEKEIIFLGGGTFYKNSNLTEKGFLELGNNNKYKKNMFECWYSLSNKDIEPSPTTDNIPTTNNIPITNNVDRTLDAVDPIEYEMINVLQDMDEVEKHTYLPLTEEEKKTVFDEIQKRKMMGGRRHRKSQIKRTKKRRHRKSQIKRIKRTKKRRHQKNKKSVYRYR